MAEFLPRPLPRLPGPPGAFPVVRAAGARAGYRSEARLVRPLPWTGLARVPSPCASSRVGPREAEVVYSSQWTTPCPPPPPRQKESQGRPDLDMRLSNVQQLAAGVVVGVPPCVPLPPEAPAPAGRLLPEPRPCQGPLGWALALTLLCGDVTAPVLCCSHGRTRHSSPAGQAAGLQVEVGAAAPAALVSGPLRPRRDPSRPRLLLRLWEGGGS